MEIPADLTEWGAKFSLGDGTLKRIVEEGFTSMDIVRLMMDKHIKALKLNMGQSLALEHAIKAVAPNAELTTESVSNNSASDPQPQSSAAQAEPAESAHNLSSLIDSLRQSPEESHHPDTRPMGKDKPLFVQDHCGVHYGSSGIDREVLSLGGDERLMLVSSSRKISPENTTLPQWIKGHLKIQQILTQRGELSGEAAINAYSRYGIKIADMCAIYPLPRVMRFDVEYRIKVFEGALRWGDPDPELMNFCIFVHFNQPLYKSQKPQANKRDRMPLDPASGKEICRNYNLEKGCYLKVCRFAHVCSKCFKTHPEVRHT